jgi:hypothetical protein
VERCSGGGVKELGAQLVQMQIEHAKPSEKLHIVDNFLRKLERHRPAMIAPHMTPTASSKAASCAESPPMTPTASSSKAPRSKTPGTHANGPSNFTEFLGASQGRPGAFSYQKTKGSGFGLCAAGSYAISCSRAEML